MSQADSKVEAEGSFLDQIKAKYPRLVVQNQTPHVLSLHTCIRDRTIPRSQFVFHADRLIRLLLEDALATVEYREKVITTPTGMEFKGWEPSEEICGVSILRAGESMENVLRQVLRAVQIGKILIQRDESTPDKQAKLFYLKLPQNIQNYRVLLLDPMLATGGSAVKAIEVLKSQGVSEEKLTFVTLISCPQGLENIFSHFPNITIVTSMVDLGLNEHKYILPGVGDFGDLYFGTN
eukprot:TRINITY_DN2634_c0_g1_i1.p1 TRINITY_DN2634_c0_g1~~TRINITY_DN2634_c0_g1_i1.p1  ORF type:complete len:236 (-),score=80.36 TRINITY_DN2634_c0_g1_i1:74-781(-)